MEDKRIQQDQTLTGLQKAIAEHNAKANGDVKDQVIDATTVGNISSGDMLAEILSAESKARLAAGLDPAIPKVEPTAPVEEVYEQVNPTTEAPKTNNFVQGVPILEDDDMDDEEETGFVVTKDEFTATYVDREPVKGGAKELVEDKAVENIQAYMEERDEEISRVEAAKQAMESEVLSDEELDEGYTAEDINGMSVEDYGKHYQEAVVLIDKTDACKVIDFTDEDREKLRLAKTITLREVEKKGLSTIKIKRKSKHMNIETLLQSTVKNFATVVPLMTSGFTVKLRGCSVLEMIDLIDRKEGKDDVSTYKDRWSFIHDKIVETSLGPMTYSEFIKKVSYSDRPMLIYALTCASFPEEDTVMLKCGQCGKTYEHKYTIKSLLRIETMSEKLKDRFAKTIDNSHRLDTSKAYAEEAPVNTTKRIELPISGIVIDFEYKSIETFLHKNIEEWQSDEIPENLALAALLTTYISSIYIPDPNSPGEYYEIEDFLEMCETIQKLSNVDRNLINKISDSMASDSMVTFGFNNMVCPHCGTHTNMIETNIDTILFQQCERQMSTKIE